MKFTAILLALVAFTNSVEASETFETTNLTSKKCKYADYYFDQAWGKVDTNGDMYVTK